MRCGGCGCEDTKVMESRLTADLKSVRRRRFCRVCSRRFTTYEKEERLGFQIKKKQGHLEAYSRTKALKSLQLALRKRPLSFESIDTLLNSIEAQITEQVVESEDLGNRILEKLKKLDLVAYIRFASVYKDFQTLDDFQALLNQQNKQDGKNESK